jgi:hypothetical protein
MRLKYFAAIASILILAIHGAGMFLNYYVIFADYDMLAHFMGGVWVASAFLAVINQYPKLKPNGGALVNIIITAAVTALVAVLWEFFEFYTNILGNLPPNAYTDTLSDLFIGILGSVIAGVIAFFVLKRD